MLLLAFVVILLVGILLIGTGWHALDEVGFWMMVIAVITLVFMGAFLASQYIGIDAQIASDTVRYEHLKAQYESNAYESTNKIAQYNLLQKICDWNQELAKNQKLTHDFWIGIFMPDYYDDLKFIEVGFKEVNKQ